MDFKYHDMYPLQSDETEYEKLDSKHYLKTLQIENKTILKINPTALEELSKKAFQLINFFYRKSHLKNLQKIVADTEASHNDKYVAKTLLKNAVESSKGILPGCQDTGTAMIKAYKGQDVWTDVNDKEYLSKGIFKTYHEENLRYSQLAPLDMFKEKNTGSNLPAQISIYSKIGNEYHFLFVAKGGGSANKTQLYQKTKSLLNEKALYNFLTEEIKKIGTTACPPYYLTIVIGGTSAEENLNIVKLASTEYLDNLPTKGSEKAHAYRDLEWEEKVLEIAQKTNVGAQFGGKYLAHRAIVIRLPRHGASCPVGIGVSCSAHRNIKAKITPEGIFIEKLEKNPQQFLNFSIEKKIQQTEVPLVSIDLNQPIDKNLEKLNKYPVGTKILFNGPLIVARDIAHAKIMDKINQQEEIPSYLKKYPFYYAGPAKTPKDMPSGSFGPTTSNRMDPYLKDFMPLGISMISIGKGNRSKEAIDAIQINKGFYFGSIGGAAALLSKESIKESKVIEFEELGMEAIRMIKVENFPAVMIYDNKGNSLY